MKPTAELERILAEGQAAAARGDTASALAAFESALVLDPRHAGALIGAGSALMRLRRDVEAEARLRPALPHPAAVRNLGVLLMAQERHAEGLDLAQATLRQAADHGEALYLRAKCLAALGEHARAVAAYRIAARHPEHRAEATVQQGVSLAALGDFKKALETLDRAVALAPEAPIPRHHRGLVRLMMGDFARGWDDYESRWGAERFVAESRGVVGLGLVPRLRLRPVRADLAGKRLLLVGEQGVGDQIMSAGMIADAAADAQEVTCVCEPRLARLFSASFDRVRVLSPADAAGGARPPVDLAVALGSLGHAYRRDIADFPGRPYLAPRDAVRRRWSERLRAGPAGLRVGLSWRGGIGATRRSERSLPLAALAPLLDLSGCRFISLQYGDTREEVAAFNRGRANPLEVFDTAEIDDFEELAGLVSALDLVVTVQTAAAHLTGALGAPGLVLVPHNAEWRYLASGSTMPWYGSLTLLRQPARGDWQPVIAAAVDAVRARLPG